MQNMADNNWLCVNSNNRVVSTLHTFVLNILTADCKLDSQEYQKMDVKYFMVFWECDKNIRTIRLRKSHAIKLRIFDSKWLQSLEIQSQRSAIKNGYLSQKLSDNFQHIRCKDSEPHCSKVFFIFREISF